MELPYKQKLFYFFPVLFCFCMPFGSFLLSVIAACWVFTSFFNFDKEQFFKGIKSKGFLYLFSFFVLTCISAALSSNKAEAMTAIEIKLTCFFFPYLFFCFKWPVEILKRTITAFVSGCFFSCLYLIARASVFASKGETHYFFYNNFSDFIHPSYLAMYLTLAFSFIVLLYDRWFKGQKQILYSSYFFALIFSLCIVLCASKMGLIAFFVCIPLILVLRYRFLLTVKRSLILFISAVLIVFLISKLFPGSFNRLNSISSLSMANIDKTSTESTAVRVLIWEESIDLIKNNFLFGTGVGDANDELYHAYEANGLTGALSHKLNAHSQYFQTFIGMGFIGFVLLIALTLGRLTVAIRKKKYLAIIFFLLITLHFLVESMLQTSAGILFFIFFYCLFALINDYELGIE